MLISDDQWQGFWQNGYMPLGPVLSPDEVSELCARADDLALGRIHNPAIEMQLDTGGAYEDLPGAVKSFDSATELYRKIQGLESDDKFARLIQNDLFREVCAEIYGRHASVSLFRAMIMNKPARQGTVLPWHQDGGHVWKLDRDPRVTIWVALDPATRENGCMEAVVGSHRLGLLSLYGSTVDEANVAIHCTPDKVVPLEVPSGHAIMLHNWLIHRSGVNPTPMPRRAFTMCCMDGRTLNTLTGKHFPVVYGSDDKIPYRFLEEMETWASSQQETSKSAEEFALSLKAENELIRQSQRSAEAYAHSLEVEVEKLRKALLTTVN